MNEQMKKLIIILVVLLSGCGYTITPKNIDDAVRVCKDLGGLSNIELYTNGYITVTCVDKREFYYRGVK